MRIVLGLDVATRCGFAHGTGETQPTVGHYQGIAVTADDDEDLAVYFQHFRNWLRSLLVRLLADSGGDLVVIFEAPVFPKPFMEKGSGRIIQHASIKDRRRLYGLVAIVELTCADLGIANCFEESPQTLKKQLTGRGDADKEDMVRAARKMGVQITRLPGGKFVHDEADAVAAWLVGLFHYCRPMLTRWDQLLYGRGAGGLL